MIPLLVPETSGKPAAADTASAPPSPSEGEPFAGFLESYSQAEVGVDDLEPIKIAAMIEGDGPAINMPDARGDTLVETTLPGLVPPLGEQPMLDLGKTGVSPQLERALNTKSDKVLPARSLVPEATTKDFGGRSVHPSEKKEAQPLPVRPTTAQSVLESRMPLDATAKGTQEQAKLLVGERSLDPAKASVGPSAEPAAMKPLLQGAVGAIPARDMPAAVTPIQMPAVKPILPETSKRQEIQLKHAAGATPPSLPPVHSGPPPAVAIAQALPAQKLLQSDASAKVAEAEFTLAGPVTERSAAPTTFTPHNTASAGADVARHVATQIAVAVHNQPNKVTEITLNPEELGRVRLSMTAADGAITLHMSSERPETQDLLRRHIDVLAQEFRALGYASISFSFGSDGQPQPEQGAELVDDLTVPEPHEDQKPQAQIEGQPGSGMDLRL